jgi:hypothetical protein
MSSKNNFNQTKTNQIIYKMFLIYQKEKLPIEFRYAQMDFVKTFIRELYTDLSICIDKETLSFDGINNFFDNEIFKQFISFVIVRDLRNYYGIYGEELNKQNASIKNYLLVLIKGIIKVKKLLTEYKIFKEPSLNAIQENKNVKIEKYNKNKIFNAPSLNAIQKNITEEEYNSYKTSIMETKIDESFCKILEYIKKNNYRKAVLRVNIMELIGSSPLDPFIHKFFIFSETKKKYYNNQKIRIEKLFVFNKKSLPTSRNTIVRLFKEKKITTLSNVIK